MNIKEKLKAQEPNNIYFLIFILTTKTGVLVTR